MHWVHTPGTTWVLLVALVLVSCEGKPNRPAMYSTDDRPLRIVLDGGQHIDRPLDIDALTPIQVDMDPTGAPLDPHCTTEGVLRLETAEPPHKIAYERDLESEPVCGDTTYLWDGETFREKPEGRFPVPDGAYSKDAVTEGATPSPATG